MSGANTNWPEYMMGNSCEKIPVSQKNHVQVGDTLKHAISYSRSNCYITVLAKFPDTTGILFKNRTPQIDVKSDGSISFLFRGKPLKRDTKIDHK